MFMRRIPSVILLNNLLLCNNFKIILKKLPNFRE